MSEVRRYNVLTTVNVEQAGALTCELIESVTGSVVYASDYDALRLQLSRAKELLLQALAGLQLSATYLASRPLHDTESGVMREHALKEQMERISGLTEFLKEVGEG